jgi:hypothetical protein
MTIGSSSSTGPASPPTTFSSARARSPPSAWYNAPARMSASAHPVKAHTLCCTGSPVTRIGHSLALARTLDSLAMMGRVVRMRRALTVRLLRGREEVVVRRMAGRGARLRV